MEKNLVAVHEHRLDEMDERLDRIESKMDPIIEYVIADRVKREMEISKKNYFDTVKSGSIAAIIGALAGWISTKF